MNQQPQQLRKSTRIQSLKRSYNDKESPSESQIFSFKRQARAKPASEPIPTVAVAPPPQAAVAVTEPEQIIPLVMLKHDHPRGS